MKEIQRKINTEAIAADHKRCRRSAINLAKTEGKRTADKPWTVENSPATSYAETFRELIPEGEWLTDYVERKLSSRAGDAVGVELGGLGSELFAGFSPGFFKKTAGVNLSDYRESLTPDPTEGDTERNHTVVTGDMLRHPTKQKVEEWLDGDKIDFLVKRMKGGEGHLPLDPFSMAKEADYWYKQVSAGSVLLSEVPRAFWDVITAWGSLVEEHHSDGLKVKLSQSYILGTIELQKHEESPEDLPVLPLEEVIEIIESKKARGQVPTVQDLFISRSSEENEE